eukprot:364641-Chlamydomonas_euryale.AAC.5
MHQQWRAGTCSQQPEIEPAGRVFPGPGQGTRHGPALGCASDDPGIVVLGKVRACQAPAIFRTPT